jgi:hypothetical protein
MTQDFLVAVTVRAGFKCSATGKVLRVEVNNDILFAFEFRRPKRLTIV